MESTQGSPDAKVTLHEITRDSLRAILDLKVSKKQEQFVAPNAVSIAEAHFSSNAWFRAIYADETPVGFVMLGEVHEKGSQFLWRLMVDERYQGRDYGRKALELVFQHVKTMTSAKELLTSCHEGKGSPKGFYLKMGFVETGEKLDNGEIVLKLRF
jgi:diamine N-acetyltransferase